MTQDKQLTAPVKAGTLSRRLSTTGAAGTQGGLFTTTYLSVCSMMRSWKKAQFESYGSLGTLQTALEFAEGSASAVCIVTQRSMNRFRGCNLGSKA